MSDEFDASAGIPPNKRGDALLRWRSTLGWSLADVAARLGVTPRTVSSFESGAQLVQDSRWRLFLHEVGHEFGQGTDSGGMVLVLGKAQSLLDVVSGDNYAGYAISEDGSEGIIASYCVDRQTGAHRLHRQKFAVEYNHHLLKAIAIWEERRHADLDGEAAYQMHHWLTRRVLQGELKDPELIELKEAISSAAERVKLAGNASENERAELVRKLDVAIEDLISRIGKS